MKLIKISTVAFCVCCIVSLQINAEILQKSDSICTHQIVRDADEKPLKIVDNLTVVEGWKWEKLCDGGILRIHHLGEGNPEIINH